MADYAALLVRRLHDRVPMWTTLNEPWVVMDGGYMEGGLAPGHRNYGEAPIAAHHLLRAHGAAVQALRAEVAEQVGLVVNLEPKYQPADLLSQEPDTYDTAAVARAEAYMNRLFLDPVLLGRYPDELPAMFGDLWPERLVATDADLIQQPLDVLGVNDYTRGVIRSAPHVPVYGYERVRWAQLCRRRGPRWRRLRGRRTSGTCASGRERASSWPSGRRRP